MKIYKVTLAPEIQPGDRPITNMFDSRGLTLLVNEETAERLLRTGNVQQMEFIGKVLTDEDVTIALKAQKGRQK